MLESSKNNMTKKLSKDHIIRGRTAARLGAIQALYQLEQEPADPLQVILEFVQHRFNHSIEGVKSVNPDTELFQEIVVGAHRNQQSIDESIESVLSEGWRLERLETVMRAILRAATYELINNPSVPKAVLINEYVELAKSFGDGREAGFVNASLDALSQKFRTGE